MCVIIIREPGITIPPDMLATACKVNKHGFGLAYINRRRLRFIRNTDTNDPEVIQTHLKALVDQRVFLHLRHATVGEISMENNHPFSVLEHRESGIDLAFMHNGTLNGWTPRADNNKISDSRNFMESLVRPLALRSRAFFGAQTLNDPFFLQQISRETGPTSVLVFFDSRGSLKIFNKDQGEQYDGWWASNKYSFNTAHHRAGNYTSHQWTWPEDDQEPVRPRRSPENRLPGMVPVICAPEITITDLMKPGTSGFVPWKTEWEEALEAYDLNHKEPDYQKMLSKAGEYSWQEYGHQMNTVKQFVTTALIETPENAMAASVTPSGTKIEHLSTSRPSFKEQMEIDDITEMSALTAEHFVILSQKCPHAMAEAWIELCGEFVKLRNENRLLKSQKGKENV